MKLILLSLCFVAASYAAVVTQFTTQAGYDGAISSPQIFTFTGANNTAVANVGTALSVRTVDGDAHGAIDANALCGSTASSIDCFKPLLFTFLTPGNAFGFHDGDLTSDEEFVVILNFTNGDPSQQFVHNLGGNPAFTPIFFGVTSNVNLSSVEIYSRDIGSDAVGQRANTVLDIDLPGARTPEPSFLGAVGAVLVAIGWRRKRKA
jgi:hypothetical protein